MFCGFLFKLYKTTQIELIEFLASFERRFALESAIKVLFAHINVKFTYHYYTLSLLLLINLRQYFLFASTVSPENSGRLISVALLVSQVCSEDGMEFTLRTPEGFIGRIYTYGYYDRCYFRGKGGTVNVLRISGPQGYPECGTQRVRELEMSKSQKFAIYYVCNRRFNLKNFAARDIPLEQHRNFRKLVAFGNYFLITCLDVELKSRL